MMLDDESSDCTSMEMDERAATISPSPNKFEGLVAESKDGPCCTDAAPRPVNPALVSKETFDTLAAKSEEGPRFNEEVPFSTDDGLLAPSSPSILVMPNAHLSNIGLLPKDEDGDGRGCEPVMKIDSDLGVWLPPRPLEGGTPTRRVGGVLALAEDAASSV